MTIKTLVIIQPNGRGLGGKLYDSLFGYDLTTCFANIQLGIFMLL